MQLQWAPILQFFLTCLAISAKGVPQVYTRSIANCHRILDTSRHPLESLLDVLAQGIAPPLLVYADLMATGDDRNIETAGIIYDKYLVRPDRQDR